MAKIEISNFKKVEKESNSIHKNVEGTYSIFAKNGIKYFQIDTYGSIDRKIPNKVSQSVQFDANMAKQLIELLKLEFNI